MEESSICALLRNFSWGLVFLLHSVVSHNESLENFQRILKRKKEEMKEAKKEKNQHPIWENCLSHDSEQPGVFCFM